MFIPSCRLPHRSQRGFTLVELMMVVVVAAILMVLGGPSFQTSINRNNINKAARDMRTTLALARDAAVSRSVAVRLCPSSDHTTCGGTFNDGWLIYIDADGNSALGSTEEVVRGFEGVSSSVDIAASAATVGFNSRGYATNAITFTFCHVDHDATYESLRQAVEVTAAGVVGMVDRGGFTCIQ